LETRKPAPSRQQGLLQHVLGIRQRTEHPIAVSQELTPVRVGELAKCLFVADSSSLHDGLLHAGQHAIVYRQLFTAAFRS
jgi:hypothetical protein